MHELAPPILSNQPGSFPWGIFHERHPVLVERLCEATPYPSGIRRALDDLLSETLDGVITPLDSGAHDVGSWRAWSRDQIGRRWSDVPFLWAESYFYRRLLQAVRYFEPGPWFAVDPFEPFKTAALDDDALDTELASLDHLLALPEGERLPALLPASLWGNRADLGFAMVASTALAAGATESGLVADDTAQLMEVLTGAPGEVCMVTDNAAGELIADLVLVDHLLAGGPATTVALHVKPAPYYVSDATTADVLACLRRLAGVPGRAAQVSRRLRQAMISDRLAVRTHPYYCAPLPYHDLPADLADQYRTASLTIMKGDLNYRRLVDDRHWPATTPFADVTGYFPGPVAALRILKSDVVVGVDPAMLAALEASGSAWRTSGSHALVQVRL